MSATKSIQWLTNWKFDLFIFVFLPIATLSGGRQLFPPNAAWQWIPVFLVFLVIENGHGMSTLLYTYFDKNEFFSKKWIYLTVPILFTAFLAIIFFNNRSLYFAIFGICLTIHQAQQQVGFAIILNKKNNLPDSESKLDRIYIYATIFAALCIWASKIFIEDFGYWKDGDIPKLFSKIQLTYILLIYVLFSLFYFYRLLVGMIKFSVGQYIAKLTIIFSTVVLWIGGVVVLKTQGGFWLALNLVHGLPFLFFAYMRYNMIHSEKGLHVHKYKFFFYTILISLITTIPLKSDFLANSILAPILLVPTYLHMFFDIFLWKSKNNLSTAKLVYGRADL